MPRTKPKSPRQVQRERVERLLVGMDKCARVRGEAQWTNGYRAAKGREFDDSAEGERMWQKERGWWTRVETTDNAFRRLCLKVLREVERGR